LHVREHGCAALIFGAGWKMKDKVDNMFAVPKPASVMGKLSQFWDGISFGGGAAKKQPRWTTQQVKESILLPAVDRKLTELHKDMLELQRQTIAALAEEMKRSREARPEDYQRDGDFSRPPPPTTRRRDDRA
jgi:hypothetical protein